MLQRIVTCLCLGILYKFSVFITYQCRDGLTGDLALENAKGFLKLFIWIKNKF